MALIKDSDAVQIEIPHEPGQWVKLRPVKVRDVRGTPTDKIETTLIVLSKVLLAWSYEEEISVETLVDLDAKTWAWLEREIDRLSGMRSEEEKNDSRSDSLPTSA